MSVERMVITESGPRDIPTTNDELIVVVEFPTTAPRVLFTYWTQPPLLTQWWSQEAEIEPKLDGGYHLAWSQMQWHLRGRYTSFEPGKRLAFTWAWDHEPDNSTKDVTIDFARLVDGGTRLTLTHSVYTESAESQQERQSHLEGWLHFLTRLQALTAKGEQEDYVAQ